VATAVLCRLGAAREYQKMAANRKPKVGAARRAAPRLRRECAVLSANPPAEPPGRRVGCYGNTQNFGKLSGLRSYGLPENMIICGTPLSAVLCRLGAGPRMAQILANRKKGRAGSPSGPKLQARTRRLPKHKSSRRAAGTQRRELLNHPEFRQRELQQQYHQHLTRVLVLKRAAPASIKMGEYNSSEVGGEAVFKMADPRCVGNRCGLRHPCWR
jgi:hypothetical protein